MKIGIDTLAFYTPRYSLDLKLLAKERQESANKYIEGIGQEKMSVAPPCEDIVTMGASAAITAIQDIDKNTIKMLLFATETSIDESKSAGIYVHQLLDLPSTCLVVELKQACSSGTAALKMALACVQQEPHSKVLIIAADVATYSLHSAAEPTQGAGACALIVSTNPRLMTIDPWWGYHSTNINDFWRPQYSPYPVVNGKQSVKYYLISLEKSLQAYCEQSSLALNDFDALCMHLPFSKIVEKALNHLFNHPQYQQDEASKHRFLEHCQQATLYNRLTGNCYTASLFQSLLSLLETTQDSLANKRIGLFSYGSGCMALFFSGKVVNGYEQFISSKTTLHSLDSRIPINYEQYVLFHQHDSMPDQNGDLSIPLFQVGHYYFQSIRKDDRIYADSCSDS